MSEKEEAAEAKEAPRMFDALHAIELQDMGAQLEPFVSYSYPKILDESKMGFVNSVTQFCFPDVSGFPTDSMDDELFSFVLTTSEGDRRFGYCLRKLPAGQGQKMPVAFTLLAYFPCFPLFATLLKQVALYYFNTSSTALTEFIAEVLSKPLPGPGESIEVKLKMTEKGAADTAETWRFTRPDEEDSLLEFVDFEPLLELMDVETILIVFASLLVERRTIFISSKLSVLSSCVQSILALLYPFTWQHICIPVLPRSLLSFCCAPMPFVVGVTPSALPEVLSLPMEEVLMVDLDKNSFLRKPASCDDYQLLPNALWNPVIKALKESKKEMPKHKKRRRKIAGGDSKMEANLALYDGKRISTALADAFLEFFVKMLGAYRHFVQEGSFDRDGFIDAQPSWEMKQFMELFCGSQMFEMFIEQRKLNRFHNSAFEKRVNLGKLQENIARHMVSKEGDRKSGGMKGGKKVWGALKTLAKRSSNAAANEELVISDPSSAPPGASEKGPVACTRQLVRADSAELVGKKIQAAAESKEESLALTGSGLLEFPPAILECASLTKLDLTHNKVKCIPEDLGRSCSLIKSLVLQNNALASLPESFSALEHLEVLDLSTNCLTAFPPSLQLLPALKELTLEGNQLSSLWEPLESSSCSAHPRHWNELQKLNVSHNKLARLEEGVFTSRLRRLRVLVLSHNDLEELPSSVCLLTGLTDLSVSSNKISSLPRNLSCLRKLYKVSFARNRLEAIPSKLCEATSLHRMNFDHNKITALPSTVGKLTGLRDLSIRHNRLEEIPDSICKATRLSTLVLDHNSIASLPEKGWAALTSLTSLSVSSNSLATIPSEISVLLSAGTLKMVSFKNNPLEEALAASASDPKALAKELSSRHEKG